MISAGKLAPELVIHSTGSSWTPPSIGVFMSARRLRSFFVKENSLWRDLSCKIKQEPPLVWTDLL